MKIIKEPISIAELKAIAREMFGDLVKAVVDVEKRIMAINGELHADEEGILLESGSKQENLWGINLYPELAGEDFIEFDSMINVRPTVENLSRAVDDPITRKKITQIVNHLIQR